jgi:hypothetical protein
MKRGVAIKVIIIEAVTIDIRSLHYYWVGLRFHLIMLAMSRGKLLTELATSINYTESRVVRHNKGMNSVLDLAVMVSTTSSHHTRIGSLSESPSCISSKVKLYQGCLFLTSTNVI